MVPPDVDALSATPGPSIKSARCDQPLLGGVATTWAIGLEQSERSPEPHGDRKSTGRESDMVREKTVTV